MNKKYRIDIFLVGGTTYSTTLSEQQKDRMVEVLEEKRIERMSFGPDIENNDTYIVNLKNVNLIKISEEK
ncbi:MAG: hypothetical protein BHV96_05435 [Clostridium sp. CAG:354_28_25]|nr:MAG: hypothetical protein BHV96_05435 [Clostridium sp. CAG:354_28_25]